MLLCSSGELVLWAEVRYIRKIVDMRWGRGVWGSRIWGSRTGWVVGCEWGILIKGALVCQDDEGWDTARRS